MVLRVKPIFGKSASCFYDGETMERYVVRGALQTDRELDTRKDQEVQKRAAALPSATWLVACGSGSLHWDFTFLVRHDDQRRQDARAEAHQFTGDLG
jgi:hypothetical protein